MGRKLLAALLAALMLSTAALAAAPGPEIPEIPELPAETVTEPEEFPAVPDDGGEEASESPAPDPAPESVPDPAEQPEDPETVILEPFSAMVVQDSSDREDFVTLLEAGTWKAGSGDYRAQLNIYEQKIYDRLTNAFTSDSTADVTYGTLGDKKVAQVVFKETKEVRNAEVKYLTQKDIDAVGTWLDEKNLIYVNQQTAQCNVGKAMTAFTYDHPEFFWLRTDFRSSISLYTEIEGDRVGENSYTNITAYAGILEITMDFTVEQQFLNGQTRREQSARVQNIANGIIKECEGLPTVARLAHFDAWLAESNAYNDAAASGGNSYMQSGEQKTAPWNVTGAFFEQLSPVCEGYSKAFQLLCHKIGLKCITVSSKTHMWNMVQLEDGSWYYVDCTWNDPNINYDDNRDGKVDRVESSAHSNRNYFLIDHFEDSENQDNTRNEDHDIVQDLPVPASAAKNYFDANWYMDLPGNTGTAAGSSMMAVYDVNQKMLDVQDCCSFYWTEDTNRLIGPALSASVQSAAKTGKIITVGEGYKPAGPAVGVPFA